MMRAYLEITNICNRSCPFCPGGEKNGVFVPSGVLERRLGRLRGIADRVYLHVRGEPLLHPEFERIAGLCTDTGIPVELVTNGTRIREKGEILLHHPIFRQVDFSLHSLSEGEDVLLNEILDFCLAAPMYINLRLWNLKDDFACLRKNEWILRTLEDRLGIGKTNFDFSPGRKSRLLKNRIYLNCDTVFEWPEDASPAESDRGFCHGLLNQFAVLSDGTVVPCCLDWRGSIPLGNLDIQELPDILNAARASAIREGFASGRVSEAFCRRCTFRRRFNSSKKLDFSD